ncbi:MAG: hypothetical protein MK008_12270 [Bdellovibrionales bacterium]|nr:hypothetical protein [Bdellovibrionales bacterium]
MMMECPKCGFQQPEDEFCAQCGINIAAFKNKPLPKAKKLWNKLSVQISLTLVLITVLSTVWYIKNNQPNQTPEQLSAVWEKDISQTSSKPQLEPQETPSNNSEQQPQPEAYENMEPQELNQTATLSREEPEVNAQDTQQQAQSMEFTSSIIEAPLNLLQGLGQSVYRNGNVIAIEFDPNENFQDWLQQLQQQDQLIVLQPVEKNDWHNSSFAQFRDQILINEDTGYSTTITLRPQPDNNAQLEVRTANTRPQEQTTAPDEGIQTYTIPVKPKKAYVVFGFFPRPESVLNMPELKTPNRVLSVLSSPDFIGGASDLALIFVLN